MRRFIVCLPVALFVVGMLSIVTWSAAPLELPLEPPHFSDPVSFPADCYQCHITSPHHGPFSSYPAALDQLCEGCHFDGGPATAVKTHSSRTTDNGYGNWDLDCWACHNQHTQEQNKYYGTSYGKYIRRYLERSGTVYGQIKEIDPLDLGPYYEPVSIIREVTSSIVEFKGKTWFVDGDAEAADDICQVCHLQTGYYNTGTEKNFHADYGSDSQAGGDCTSCHSHNEGFVASGGHSSTDFAWNDTTKVTCGAATTCHDWSNNQNVVVDVHNDICLNCHDNNNGGNGTTVDRDVGFATLGSTATPHTDACTVCHTLVDGHTHHDRSDSYAASGTCTRCHDDPRDDAGYLKEAQATQLACRACHVSKNGTTLEILAIAYAKQDSADATGDDSGNTYEAMTTPAYDADHTFGNTNATDETDAIDNYGVCFECHGFNGRTGYESASAPSPYHAMPLAGAYLLTTNTIGGNGWNNNLNASGTIANFRGNLNHAAGAVDSYFPIGKGKMNLGYAQHSLAKGATADVYRTQNAGAQSTFSTLAAGMVYGMQTVDHLSGENTYAVPHFSSVCNASTLPFPCDNVTVGTVTQIKDGGTTLGFSFTVTSSTGADLHIIWGGVELATVASGGTYQHDWRPTDKNDPLDDIYCMDQFNPGELQDIFVVSEEGGSASVAAADLYLRGSGTSDLASPSPGCSRYTTFPNWTIP